MDKKVLLALSALLGANSIAQANVKDVVTNYNDLDSNSSTIAAKKRKSQFVLKVNFDNLEDSKACFHASHASHSSHASHASHSSSSFV